METIRDDNRLPRMTTISQYFNHAWFNIIFPVTIPRAIPGQVQSFRPGRGELPEAVLSGG